MILKYHHVGLNNPGLNDPIFDQLKIDGLFFLSHRLIHNFLHFKFNLRHHLLAVSGDMYTLYTTRIKCIVFFLLSHILKILLHLHKQNVDVIRGNISHAALLLTFCYIILCLYMYVSADKHYYYYVQYI